jgi:hypothetical protein
MKTLQSICAGILLLLMVQSVLAQHKTRIKVDNAYGLYYNFDDFRTGKLTYPMDCENPEDKLKLNDWFGSSRGYLWSNGEKHPFDKNQIYGYRDSKKENHRFYMGEGYKILDTAGIFLYYKYTQKEVTRGKSLIKTDEYYFSVQGNSPICLLTSQNLKTSFPYNHRFQYLLDAGFKSDGELIAFDDIQKIYKIEYLYNQSLK